MKICEFSTWDLMHTKIDGMREGLVLFSPTMQAIAMLKNSLEIINQAGLDGKKLTELKVIAINEPSEGPHGGRIEVHAKVTHRLKTDNARQENANAHGA
jgi:hypothetical protein